MDISQYKYYTRICKTKALCVSLKKIMPRMISFADIFYCFHFGIFAHITSRFQYRIGQVRDTKRRSIWICEGKRACHSFLSTNK